MSQASANKRQRERDRQAKAVAKAERRELRLNALADATTSGPTADQGTVLAELAALHARFDAEQIELDDFLEQKAALMQQLVVPDA
ncbi:MAG: hypothetical protein U0Q03_23600 [Acidimicrobiales bacterium]